MLKQLQTIFMKQLLKKQTLVIYIHNLDIINLFMTLIFLFFLFLNLGDSLEITKKLRVHNQMGGGSFSRPSFSSSFTSSIHPSFSTSNMYISTLRFGRSGQTNGTQSSTSQESSLIIFYVIIGLIAIPFLIIIILQIRQCCKKSNYCNSSINPLQRMAIFENQFNILDRQSMTIEEFQGKRTALEFALKQQQNNFCYFVEGKCRSITIQDVKMVKKEDFLYSLSLKAVDEVGSWYAEGYFLVSNHHIKLWFLKIYNNQEFAGQMGDFSWLIYELDQETDNNYRGRWYYDKFKGSLKYSGIWTFFNIVDSQSISLQQFQRNKFAIEFALKHQQYKFSYLFRRNNYQVTIQDIKMVKERDFLYSLSLKAVDEVGSWLAQGYFLVSNRKIKLWFFKTYDNREAARVTGDQPQLFYESNQQMNGSYCGKWYSNKFEGNTNHSGTWTLDLSLILNNPSGNMAQKVPNVFSQRNYQ